MNGREVASYGRWRSPVTARVVAGESVRIGEPSIEGDCAHWLELRPGEGGRNVLVRCGPDGAARDVLPSPWNVRTRVHEYGGGSYATSRDTLYFSHFEDGRLYRFQGDGEPEALTPAGRARYADLAIDARRGRLLAVCEDHSDEGREAVQSIAAIAAAPGGSVKTLVTGADFYSNPRLSPDGSTMCWLQWNHPNMPWDGTELWIAEIGEGGSTRERRRIAGGPRESIFQPQWSADGKLHFVSDRSGYWNLYRLEAGTPVALHRREAEFGLPQWVFGMSTYGFMSDGRIVCAYCENGSWQLGLLDGRGGTERLDTGFSHVEAVAVSGNHVVFLAGSTSEPLALVRLRPRSGSVETLRRSAEVSGRLKDYFSESATVSFLSEDGSPVHAIYYAPRNPRYMAPADEKPPLIIRLHGGPTAAANDALSLGTQFWTSRGFAVVDLNYGGSTGYGRAYRERLDGQWGVVDVNDTVAAARHFVKQGLADRNRIIVKGGSAGGYTVLCCLAFRDEFAAGASYYGVSDLGALAKDTHKFESRYLDRLIGRWPEDRKLYEERSPLAAADRMSSPTIFFQGSDDRVVPPDQTESIVAALRAGGVPVAYHLFDGEGHGFRDGSNVRKALEAELSFYREMVLGA